MSRCVQPRGPAAALPLLPLLLLAAWLTGWGTAQTITVTTSGCSATQYFDNSALQCYECADSTVAATTNYVPDTADLNALGYPQSCTCAPGYKKDSTTCGLGGTSQGLAICEGFTCSECPANQAATQDKSACLPCDPGGVADSSQYDATTKSCNCNHRGAGYHIVERDAYTGELFTYQKCLPCPSRSRVIDFTADPYTCASCAHPNMTYSTANEICECDSGFERVGVAGYGELSCVYTSQLVSASVATSASQIYYWSLEETFDTDWRYIPLSTYNSNPVTSVVYQHFIVQAASRCSYFTGMEDIQYCEQLANLCAMQLYDSTAAACSILASIQQSNRPTVTGYQQWKETVPWVIYSDNAQTLYAKTLPMQMSFNQVQWTGTYDSLNLTLAKYALNGTFLGLEPLSDQFFWCDKVSAKVVAGGTLSASGGIEAPSIGVQPFYGVPPSRSTRWTKHGTSFSERYWCDLDSIIEMDETVFYDVYIVDKSLSSSSELALHPVPVRIINYDGRSNALPPNVNINTLQLDDDVFHRRIFMYDAISSISSAGGSPNVVRYADYIEIETQIVATNPKLIHVPIITVHYQERAYPLAGVMKTDQVEFRVNYTQNMDSFWSAATIFFVIAMVVSAFYLILRTLLYMRRNSRPGADMPINGRFLIRLVLWLFSSFSTIMFWFIFGVSMYWFVFYKISTTVFCMMPTDRLDWRGANDYYPFRVILGLCFVGQLFHIIEIILMQTSVDIFLMDWETPRGKLVNPKEAGGEQKTAPISAWRTIFCANEWNEMQTLRATNMDFTILFVLFLFVGCDLQYIATQQPHVGDLTPGEINPVLRFANTTLWIFIISLIQAFLNWSIIERYLTEPKSQQFRDLCNVAKISLFILDERYHGYYLHCNSPAPYADATMLEMAHNFKSQQNGMMMQQPMPDGQVDADNQPLHDCFEVYVTRQWRAKYDEIFTKASQRLRTRKGGGAEGGGPKKFFGNRLQAVPPDQLLKAYRRLNRFLRHFVNKTSREHKREMRVNTFQNRVLRIPPDLSSPDTSVIFGDSNFRFRRVIFLGEEYNLLIFNILTWAVMDLWLDDTAHNNPVAAALVTWLVDRFIRWVRSSLGAINLNTKTLVDGRFLL